MDAHLQNDPERAGGLVSDAQGEFVQQESGGVFDPRAFREDTRSTATAGSGSGSGSAPGDPAEPAMDDERMVGPGEEIDKAR